MDVLFSFVLLHNTLSRSLRSLSVSTQDIPSNEEAHTPETQSWQHSKRQFSAWYTNRSDHALSSNDKRTAIKTRNSILLAFHRTCEASTSGHSIERKWSQQFVRDSNLDSETYPFACRLEDH